MFISENKVEELQFQTLQETFFQIETSNFFEDHLPLLGETERERHAQSLSSLISLILILHWFYINGTWLISGTLLSHTGTTTIVYSDSKQNQEMLTLRCLTWVVFTTICHKVIQFLCTDLDLHCFSTSLGMSEDNEMQNQHMVGNKIFAHQNFFKPFISGLPKICNNSTGKVPGISAQCTVLIFFNSDVWLIYILLLGFALTGTFITWPLFRTASKVPYTIAASTPLPQIQASWLLC